MIKLVFIGILLTSLNTLAMCWPDNQNVCRSSPDEVEYYNAKANGTEYQYFQAQKQKQDIEMQYQIDQAEGFRMLQDRR